MDGCLHAASWVRVDPDSVELVANTPLPKHICYILESAGTSSRGIRKAVRKGVKKDDCSYVRPLKDVKKGKKTGSHRKSSEESGTHE